MGRSQVSDRRCAPVADAPAVAGGLACGARTMAPQSSRLPSAPWSQLAPRSPPGRVSIGSQVCPLVLPQEGMLPGMKVCELRRPVSKLRRARWRGCGRGGVIITRSAVHSPGPYFLLRHGYDDRCRDLPPEGSKPALNDRMLLVAKRRIDSDEPAYDGQRSELRFDSEPGLDRREMGIEL